MQFVFMIFNADQPGVGRVHVLGIKKVQSSEYIVQRGFCWLSSGFWFEVQVGRGLHLRLRLGLEGKAKS